MLLAKRKKVIRINVLQAGENTTRSIYAMVMLKEVSSKPMLALDGKLGGHQGIV